jgi:regulator of CtrA degradation
MPQTKSINPQIVDALYCDALLLSDEVRAAFKPSARLDGAGEQADLARIALSSEGLRTTTRMMQAIAWLLNLRAYFMGELSELQLRRYGRLSHDLLDSDSEQMEMLSPDMRELIAETQRFYERLMRLDRNWQQPDTGLPMALERLRMTFEQHAEG